MFCFPPATDIYGMYAVQNKSWIGSESLENEQQKMEEEKLTERVRQRERTGDTSDKSLKKSWHAGAKEKETQWHHKEEWIQSRRKQLVHDEGGKCWRNIHPCHSVLSSEVHAVDSQRKPPCATSNFQNLAFYSEIDLVNILIWLKADYRFSFKVIWTLHVLTVISSSMQLLLKHKEDSLWHTVFMDTKFTV